VVICRPTRVTEAADLPVSLSDWIERANPMVVSPADEVNLGAALDMAVKRFARSKEER
jgi:hypothetical protein